jgi:hypothetical protein
MAALRAVLSFAVVALIAAPAPAQELLNDAKLGIKLKAPDGYTRVPLKPDEEWIVARWISDRSYYQNDKSGFSIDHKPELTVVAFPSSKVKEKVEEKKSGTGEQSRTTLIFKNPYKDYKDYLARTYSDGGYFVEKVDKAEVEGVQVETQEIKVEKGTFGGPRKIVTWIYKCDDADFAVSFELVENAWSKLKGDVLSTMRSFRRISKDANASSAPTAPPMTESLKDLSPAQRAARRRELETKSQERFVKNLTEGWTAKKYGRVFVLNHADEKCAQRVAENANAILDYCDSNLGYIGPGEYVRAPIVRICKDYDEYATYHKGGGTGIGAIITTGADGDFDIDFFDPDRELLTYKDVNSTQYTSEDINSGVAQHWLREHDERVYMRTPFWLRIGMQRCFDYSKSKGGKVDFFSDSRERVGLSQQAREGKMSKFQDLVKMDPETLSKDRKRYDECAAATRYLLTGPKKAKDLLRAYFDGVGVIAKRDAEEAKKNLHVDEKKAKSIEEEDARFKEDRQERQNRAKKNLEEVYNAAFGTWTDAEWKTFQSAYEKSIG